jgi:hypothetical protein
MVNDVGGHTGGAESLEILGAFLHALRAIVDAQDLDTLIEWTIC